jgi:hypothetical protein
VLLDVKYALSSMKEIQLFAHAWIFLPKPLTTIRNGADSGARADVVDAKAVVVVDINRKVVVSTGMSLLLDTGTPALSLLDNVDISQVENVIVLSLLLAVVEVKMGERTGEL